MQKSILIMVKHSLYLTDHFYRIWNDKMTYSRLKIALLLSYIGIASASAAMITPALPNIQRDYSLSQGALEWIVSLFLLGYVMGQLLYGPIANRFGRLVALRSGLVINLSGIILCLITTILPHYFLLLVGRFLTALGAASGLSCTLMLIISPSYRV